MMRQVKFFRWLTSAAVCSLLLTAGCAHLTEETAKPEIVTPEPARPEVITPKPAELEPVTPKPAKPEVVTPKAATPETVTLALKFAEQDSTTYRVLAEAEQSVKWEGPLPDKSIFKGGRSQDRIEMTFTQQIQSSDDKGNAIAEITIKGLKYFSTIKDNSVMDFDSSREKDRNSPLARLIGQSYTIEITPTGKVTEVIDVTQAQAAVKGNKTALKLLLPDAIKERHGLMNLPAGDKNQLGQGDSWSGIKTFSFGLMGSKSYEKIYTLKEIKDQDNRQIAIVEMSAIPTSEMAEQLHKEQATPDFSKMFDNTETYTGRLKLDLTVGKVEKYFEKLQSEWVVARPPAEQGDDKEPTALKMGAIRLYHLEKID